MEPRGSRTLGRWLLLCAATLALAITAFFGADGAAYLRDAPEACANCHVMRPVYEAWSSGRHRAVAVCNDCHTPAGTAAKWRTKATSGALHAWAWASNRYEPEIRIRPASLAIAQQNCARCHADVAESLHHGGRPPEDRPCAQCHARVGHS